MLGRPPIADKVEHFWSKAEPEPNTGCWLWTGGRKGDGYGKFSIRGDRTWIASRFAWTATHGPIPDGLWVLHRCDNPTCVNPGHLRLGTVLENAADRERRGRSNYRPGVEAARRKRVA